MTDYTSGPDTVTGTSGDDVMNGLGGNDNLSGAGGNDVLDGGADNDTLNGNAGSDTLTGGAGNDQLNDGAGANRLDGGDGDDTLNNARSVDADTLSGGVGNDYLAASNWEGFLTGTAPPIVPIAFYTGSVFDGGEGFDYFSARSHIIFRGELLGIEGVELLGGFNFPVPGTSFSLRFDPAIFEIGSQTVSQLPATTVFRGGGQVVVNLDTHNTFDGSGYTFVSGSDVAFTVNGTAGADTITGTANGDLIRAWADDTPATGGDSLSGGGGADTLEGSDGNDTLAGGTGADVFEISAGQDVIIDFNVTEDRFDLSEYGFDSFTSLLPYLSDVGGNAVFSVTYNGQPVTHTFQGVSVGSLSANNSILAGANPVDHTGEDAGTPNADLLPGGGGNDSIDGAGGADTLVSFGGNDSLLGGAGEDSLNGGAGVDTLDGGAGNDTLDGGLDKDVLAGGEGNDVLIQDGPGLPGEGFNGGSGTDTLRVSSATLGAIPGLFGETVYLAQFFQSSVTSIERIEFSSVSGSVLQPQFLWFQLGAGLATNAELVGGPGIDQLVLIPLNAGTYQLPTFTLTNWTTLTDGSGSSDTLVLAAGSDGNYVLRASATHVGWQSLIGRGGHDTLEGGDGYNYLDGNAGNDVLDGAEGSDVLTGDLGDDTLDGGLGNDALYGGDGNDVLEGDEGNDTLNGGAGNDLFGISTGQDVITDFNVSEDKFDLSEYGFDSFTSLLPYLSNLGGNAVFSVTYNGLSVTHTFQGVSVGSLSANNLIVAGANPVDHTGEDAGTPNADLLPGGSGNDSIDGGGGTDTLVSFGGNDSLLGGAGDDSLSGGAGTDTLDSGVGNDTLDGGDGNDVLSGGDGDDVLLGGGGADTVTSGSGADVLTLSSSVGATLTVTDFAPGDAGDTLSIAAYLTAHTSWTSGNPFASGHLRLVQNGPHAVLEVDADGGGNSFAPVVTFQDINVLDLTAFNLGGWAPVISGGSGADSLVYTPPAPAASEGSSPVVDGGAGTDVLTISTAALTPAQIVGPATISPSADGTKLLLDLNGDGITDLIVTNVEDIVLNGQNVVINGNLSATGLAPNTIHYNGTSGNDVLDARGLTSLESIRAKGFAGNDSLIGGNDDDTLEGGDGNDSLNGRGGPDSLNGGSGNDQLRGGEDGDRLAGEAGNDKLFGENGADILDGGDGGDQLDGGNGKDSLSGGAGDDVLRGGTGNDFLTGGSGADNFIIEKGGGTDRIFDFGAGDRLVFEGGSGSVTWEQKDLDGDGLKDDLLVSSSGGGLSVELIDLTTTTFSSSNWIFG